MSDGISDDERHMRRALRLAALGRGRTAPNPMVGCVLVRDGKVLATGWHRRAGTAHAEAAALAKLPDQRADGATCYVTLEPCNHHGRTPPCTDALIRAGIKRVVAAMRDPHYVVDGRGIDRLRAAGIEVEVGLREAEARGLNASYLYWLATGRPLVTLKAAITLDGRLAARSGDARWVTGEAARLSGHRLRNIVGAIAVGARTIVADDPRLTTRLPAGLGRDPLRVVFDSHLIVPPTARVATKGTLFCTTETAPEDAAAVLRAGGAEVQRFPSDETGRVDIGAVLSALGQRGIHDLLVEGGGRLLGAFVRHRLAQRMVAYVAPKLVGAGGIPLLDLPGPEKMDQAWPMRFVEVRRLGDDVMISGDLVL